MKKYIYIVYALTIASGYAAQQGADNYRPARLFIAAPPVPAHFNPPYLLDEDTNNIIIIRNDFDGDFNFKINIINALIDRLYLLNFSIRNDNPNFPINNNRLDQTNIMIAVEDGNWDEFYNLLPQARLSDIYYMDRNEEQLFGMVAGSENRTAIGQLLDRMQFLLQRHVNALEVVLQDLEII